MSRYQERWSQKDANSWAIFRPVRLFLAFDEYHAPIAFRSTPHFGKSSNRTCTILIMSHKVHLLAYNAHKPNTIFLNKKLKLQVHAVFKIKFHITLREANSCQI